MIEERMPAVKAWAKANKIDQTIVKAFQRKLGVITVGKEGAVLQSSMPIRFSSTVKASGLSIAPGKVGSSAETPLLDAARYDASKADYSDAGLDTEAIVVDTDRGVLWISDEYGPSVYEMDRSGAVVKEAEPAASKAARPVSPSMSRT